MATITSLGDAFAAIAEQRPHDVALTYKEEWYTFREVYNLSCNLSNSLINKYLVKKGDLVVIALKNSPEWLVSFLAIVSIGAVVVPVEGWDLNELEGLFSTYSVPVALVDKERLYRFDSILKDRKGKSKLKGVVLCRSSDTGMVPYVDHWRSMVHKKQSTEMTVAETMTQLLQTFPTTSKNKTKNKGKDFIKNIVTNILYTDVACAVPVTTGPFQRIEFVELTHGNWLRAMDGLELETISTKNSSESSSVYSVDARSSTFNDVTLFCPVPLRTLLSGETVHVIASVSMEPNDFIDWSSSWLQPIHQIEEENVSRKTNSSSTKRMALLDTKIEGTMKEFVDQCEARLMSHPSVTAASIFVDYRSLNKNTYTDDMSLKTSSVKKSLWGAVVLDKKSNSPSMNELLELCQERLGGLDGLVKWQQRGITTLSVSKL
jgi:hypothetical protein